MFRIYKPDFVLNNGIIIEVKGWFKQSDRMKHLAIKEQHPKLDIRFVFTSTYSRIYKGSKTTYGDWCNHYGFEYHCIHSTKELFPKKWIKEIKSLNAK